MAAQSVGRISGAAQGLVDVSGVTDGSGLLWVS
jgi:hypothetical protein